MGWVRLVVIIWIFGVIALVLAATSTYVYSTEAQPGRGQRWASRLRIALMWPIALLSAGGRARLRRG